MKVVPANRRMVTLAVTLTLLIALVMVGAFVRVPYVSLGPGPTLNTLGSLGRDPVVKISGAPVRQTDGHLNLTTVSVTDGLTLFQAMGMWFSGRDALQPREEVYPPGKTTDEVRRDDVAQFTGSEDSATIAALRFLKRPVAISIAESDGPAAGVLRVGEQVVSVDGAAVTTPDELRSKVSGLRPGAQVTIGVVVDAAASVPAGSSPAVQQRTVTLGARPDDKDRGYLGVSPELVNADPSLKIDFNVGDIGGPSAGLMLTLGIIDKLGSTDLTGGRFIAGTGTMADDGEVGEIGGITHKTLAAREAGATQFLVPAGNCAEARSDAPDGLTLVKVGTLTDAMSALATIRGGGTPTQC